MDYILYSKSFCRTVRDVKVIPSEECIQQHRLVVCDFTVHIPHKKAPKFTPRIRTWKLKDPATAGQFQETFKLKANAINVDSTSDNTTKPVECHWNKLKEPLLQASIEVCGQTKNHQWRAETWWWNEQVDAAIQEKRNCYKVYKSLSERDNMVEAKKAKMNYINAKRRSKHAVYLAKSAAEKEEFATVSPNGDGVFRIAKQMERTNQDIVGDGCI